MTVTTALARWSRRSNRKRAVETAARAAPWLAATGAVTLFVREHAGLATTVATAAMLALIVLALAVRRQRRVRLPPAALARVLDGQHRTVDLLQTALAVEARTDRDSLDTIVLARAGELVPRIENAAVAPLRLRAHPLAGLSAVAACALLLLTGADTRDEPAFDPAAELMRAKSAELAKAVDQLANDSELSREDRAKLHEAKQALERAAQASTGKAALAAMSEAQRLLDELAPHLDMPSADELAKMPSAELAKQLADAAKNGDAAKLAALSKEAMRRAALGDQQAKELANAMAAAAKKAGGVDPWSGGDFDSSPAGKRLAALSQAAQQMQQGDLDSAKSSLGELAKSMGPPRMDPRASRLASARRMLSGMRSAQRAALNGTMTAQQMQDARAAAMRAGAGSGSGSGSGRGMGSGMGTGTGKGTGKGTGMRPGSGPPQEGPGGLSVLAPGGTPGGQQGSTGSHGGTMPSGAQEPETVMAEEVTAPPPTSISPEGVIRAIAEHAQGDHVSTQFGPVRDHYEAIAESAIHRDEIPLTRRDFIQRYFEALRTREEP